MTISIYLKGHTVTHIDLAIKDYTTIRRWILKLNKTGNVLVNLPKSGRKRDK